MNQSTTDNGVPGPTFLVGLTEHISDPQNLHDHEWRRRLCSSIGQKKFRIKYYGELFNDKNRLITRTEFSQPLILAVDIESGEEILLFDGCRHGYNALLCDTYTNDEITKRNPANYYEDKKGNKVFEIIISTYNGINFKDEFSEDADENGLLELIDGKKVTFDFLQSNGYDTLQIWGVNNDEETVEIVCEELA